MTDLNEMDLFGTVTTLANPAAVARRHRHSFEVPGSPDTQYVQCACGITLDELRGRARRGRTNRSRGNAIEREVAARLGLARVGHFGGPDDVRGLAFVGQVKSGGSFPERLWRWLRAVPVNAGQTAILVCTDAPGPGHKRRGVVVVDLEDWVALHGEVPS